jgi:protein-S-isoprenylcysteine O-methyltransferase Ste14
VGPLLAVKILIFTVLVPGTVTVLIPFWILAVDGRVDFPSIGVRQVLALVPIAAGLCIYAWCVWDFGSAGRGTPAPIDPPKELVVRGLYRYARNPMYVGVLSLLVGEALFFGALPLLAFAAFMFATFQSFVVLYEEPALRRTFGDAYRHYCDAVPRWGLRRTRGRQG